MINEPPYPRLPEAIVKLMADHNQTITFRDAEAFIKNKGKPPSTPANPPSDEVPENILANEKKKFDPNQPPNLYFTKIISAKVENQSASNWNDLLRSATTIAFQHGWSVDKVAELGIPIVPGHKTDSGYTPIPNTNASIQNVDANKAFRFTFLLAQKLRLSIKVSFKWRDKEGAAYPGQEGLLEWP